MNANRADDATEISREKTISLHLPSLSARALAGILVTTDTREYIAIIKPSSRVVAPTLTMKRGRMGSEIADPRSVRNVTAPMTRIVLDPANSCIS